MNQFMKHMKLTKRITALFLIMVLLLSLASGVVAEIAYTLSDVTNVLKYVAGWGDEYYRDSYDYNGDGKANLFDATCILKDIAGWSEENICLKKPSDELIKRIEADYTQHLVEKYGYDETDSKFSVIGYYGNYTDAVPIMFLEPEMGIHTTLVVANVMFYYSGSNQIQIWYKSDFLTIEEAYERGILSYNNLKRIAELHNHGGYVSYNPYYL